MSKRKRKSAVQPAPFKEHSLSEVKGVALMLYAQQPFEIRGAKSALQWRSLVWRANDFLDELHNACKEVANERKAAKETADAKKTLPAVVPFNKAVMVITGQEKLQRAWERFKVLPHLNTENLVSGKPATRADMKEWREQIACWRENGLKRNEVLWRRCLYDEKAYRYWRTATAGRAKKRRAPWSKTKLGKVQLETAAREAKKEKVVNALLKTARTGEIK